MRFDRITPEESLNYTELLPGDLGRCKRAVAFTLTPSIGTRWEGWEDVRYFTDGSIPDYKLHPLEIMYEIWNTTEALNDTGDARDLNAD